MTLKSIVYITFYRLILKKDEYYYFKTLNEVNASWAFSISNIETKVYKTLYYSSVRVSVVVQVLCTWWDTHQMSTHLFFLHYCSTSPIMYMMRHAIICRFGSPLRWLWASFFFFFSYSFCSCHGPSVRCLTTFYTKRKKPIFMLQFEIQSLISINFYF